MKKKVLIIIIAVCLTFVSQKNVAVAAAPSPANNATTQIVNKQIDQLKDKIASRVSQLNLVEKRGIVGTVVEAKDNAITLTDSEGRTRYVDVDEITKFSSTSGGASFGISDLTKGMKISVLGIYNKESQRILARFINTIVIPARYNGEIVSVDSKNFQLTVTTDDQKTVKVEIDTTSTVSSYTADSSLTKYGFSKLAVGDRIEALAYPDKKDPSLLIVDRLVDFINAPKIPGMSLVTPTNAVTPTIAPASKGAKVSAP